MKSLVIVYYFSIEVYYIYIYIYIYYWILSSFWLDNEEETQDFSNVNTFLSLFNN